MRFLLLPSWGRRTNTSGKEKKEEEVAFGRLASRMWMECSWVGWRWLELDWKE